MLIYNNLLINNNSVKYDLFYLIYYRVEGD